MIRVFKHYIPYNVVLLGILELLILLFAGEAAWHLRVSQINVSVGPLGERLPELLGFSLVVWLAMIAVGAYGPESLRSVRFWMARMLVALVLSAVALSFINFIFPGVTFWRSVLFFAMSISIVVLLLCRILMGRLLGIEALRRRILVLGAGARAERLKLLAEREGSGLAIAAFIAMGEGTVTLPDAIERSSIGDLGKFVERHGATEVVLAMQERRKALPLKDLLRVKTKGVSVNEFSTFLERETGRVDLDTLNPSWLIFSDGFSSGRWASSLTKRAFDIVASLLLLLIAVPLVALFAVLVKLDSRGPAFYRQTRVGLYGQHFEVIKLRSMRIDAEVAGAQWAEADDPRVTRVGRFIRKVRVDELPQVWNVLRGAMSFVGPRPERPGFVAELEEALPYYAERHMVKPGITGWAQINYPYGASLDDARHKLEYDLYYAKNYTLFLDILILLQTARVIIWPNGAR